MRRLTVVGALLVAMTVGVGSVATGVAPPAASVGSGPGARLGPQLSMDPSGNVVLFGGCQLYTCLSDTWTWDGTAWTEQHPATIPSPRGNFGLAYDTVREQTVLFGGCGLYACLSDTWTWDGADWTEQHPAHSPPNGADPAMAFDETTGRVLLSTDFGERRNLTWTWDGSDWTNEAPPDAPPYRKATGMAYDSGRGRVVLFGGGITLFELDGYRRDTWEWNGHRWFKQNPTVRPARRGGLGMAYDGNSQSTLIFGGCCHGEAGYSDQTWSYDGRRWTLRAASASPSPRSYPGMVWDTVRGQIVLFGGQDAMEGYYGFTDTWTWDGSTWTCVDSCS
jgi:hypothetical protein